MIVLCNCGCGTPTPIAKWTLSRQGHIKGEQQRFVRGHNRRRPLAERFWEKVDLSGGPYVCWPWLARRLKDGYGQIGLGDKLIGAHRIAWELTRGPIPSGLSVLHNCPTGDNPACVNPAHLWLGTQTQNIKDMDVKGRANRTGLIGWWTRS